MLRGTEHLGALPQVLEVPAELPDLSVSGGPKAPTQDYCVSQLSRGPGGLRQECPPTFSPEESSGHQYLIFMVSILLCTANTLFHFNLEERYKSCRFLYNVTHAVSWLPSTGSGTWAQVQGGSESVGEELGCMACPCFC